MSPAFLQYLPIGFALFLLQGLAAIPWIMLLTRYSLRREMAFFVKVVGGKRGSQVDYLLADGLGAGKHRQRRSSEPGGRSDPSEQ